MTFLMHALAIVLVALPLAFALMVDAPTYLLIAASAPLVAFLTYEIFTLVLSIGDR